MSTLSGEYYDLVTPSDVEFIFDKLKPCGDHYSLELNLSDNPLARIVRMIDLVKQGEDSPKYNEILTVLWNAFYLRFNDPTNRRFEL